MDFMVGMCFDCVHVMCCSYHMRTSMRCVYTVIKILSSKLRTCQQQYYIHTEVEADSYWCLCKLLEGIQDHYTYAQPGIQKAVYQMKELVRCVWATISLCYDDNDDDDICFQYIPYENNDPNATPPQSY